MDSSSLGATNYHILALDNLSATPTFPSDFYGLAFISGSLYKVIAGTATTVSGSGSGASTWDELYSNDKSFNINSDSLTFNLTHATNNGLTLSSNGGAAGALLKFANSGSGVDVSGTDATWSVSKAGALLITSIAGSAADTGITINANGTGTIAIGDVSTGAVTITPATTVTGAFTATASVTITGTADTNCLTVTAGDILVSNGKLAMTNDDTDAIVTLTANSVTTGNAILLTANGITSGSMLALVTTDAGLTTGFYLRCNDGSDVFTIGDEGATVIVGAGGQDIFNITAGDVAWADSSLTITDADNAATLSVTNNTATTIGAAASGGVATLISTSLTTGALLNLQLTEGTLNGGWYLRAWDATAGAGVFSVGEDGATVIAGVGGSNVLTVTAGDILGSDTSLTLVDADNAATLSITNNTATTIGAAASGGVATLISTSLTTGALLNLELTEGTLNGGWYVRAWDATAGAAVFSVGEDGATVIAGTAIGTASLTQTAGDHVLTSGNLILTSGHIKNTPQSIVNANTAISIVTLVTTISNNGASTHTLADGTVGQIKVISMDTYTGDAVITPANFVGTTITLNAAGDTWTGIFTGTEWRTLALGGTAAVA